MAETILQWARMRPCCKQLDIQSMSGFTIFTLLAARNDLPAIRALLARIPDHERTVIVRSPDRYGNTPMHYFALHANGEALRVLHGFGASLNVMNHDNASPYDVYKLGELGCFR